MSLFNRSKTPVLLSFYGLSNGRKNVFFGKLAYSPIKDLSFTDYKSFKTFKTIVALYRTRPIANTSFEMIFDNGRVTCKTDSSGSFWCEAEMTEQQTKLLSIILPPSGQTVSLTEELYPNTIQRIDSHTLVISDLDDTLIQSFVRHKFRQVKTLLFTSLEKRKVVQDVSNLIKRFSLAGAHAFYLSNSEQNLYPLLYRFLLVNQFPPGPLFLKQYIRLRKMFIAKIMKQRSQHKAQTLAKLIELFPDKKFIFIGDNTQHDLEIYLTFTSRYPENVRYIIIRKVYERIADKAIIAEMQPQLKEKGIGLHYESSFPDDLPWDLN
jgi:phosphatidate phosphatase APP1